MDLLMAPVPSHAPTPPRSPEAIRAPTRTERINQVARNVYEALAEQPLGRLADLLGLTDLAGMASPETPQSVTAMVPMDPFGGGLRTAARAPIRAYHGSPHNYNAERLVRYADGRTEYLVGQPDALPPIPTGATVVKDFPLGRQRLDKIGTGEGAQAYGHGLYEAESPGVAKRYRDALEQEFALGGEAMRAEAIGSRLPGLDDEARKHVFNVLRETQGGPVFSAPLSAQERALFQRSPKGRASLAVSDAMESGLLNRGSGSLYEVAIHANPEDLLDWDAPLSQQGPHVRTMLRDALTGSDDPIGGDIYRGMTQDARDLAIIRGQNAQTTLPASQAKAATDLRELGIPGIRYLDQGSRAAGEGTRNYVVFDDSLIEIVKKLAIAAGVSVPVMMQRVRDGQVALPGAEQ